VIVSDELVLIIEDNDKNLKLVRDVLQVHGFRTVEATDAESGLEIADDQHPDVILMDIQLPGMDGTQALAHLRARARTADIPVVAVTAFAMAGDAERFRAAGFDGYITKPISVREFPEQVRSCLTGSQQGG
jgi:two-component system, cell cycle response regulator DivK